LADLDIRDVARVDACLDDQLVVDRQQLEHGSSRRHDGTWRVVVEPDDDASYWCANLDTLHHITGRANLLVHIVKLGLCRAQLLGDLLGRRRTQLRDLLLGTRDALLGVGETSEQIAQLARQSGLCALDGRHVGLSGELPLEQHALVLQLFREGRQPLLHGRGLRLVADDPLLDSGDLLAQDLLLICLAGPSHLQLDLLALKHRLDLRIGLRSLQCLRQTKSVMRQHLGFESRLHDFQAVPAQDEAAQFGARTRLVEPQQRLAGIDHLAVAYQNLADDAAFQVLHELVLSRRHECAGCDDGAVEGSGAGPQAKAEPPYHEHGHAHCRRPAQPLRHGAMPLVDGGVARQHQ
jgi:hypothetical protein